MYLGRERGMGCDTRGRCKGCWAPRSCRQRPAVARVFIGIPLSPSRGGCWYGSYWLAPHHQSQGAGRRHCGKITASALFQLHSPGHPCELPLILLKLTWPSRMDAARVQVGVEVGDPLPEKGSIDAMVVASWSAAHDAHVRHAAHERQACRPRVRRTCFVREAAHRPVGELRRARQRSGES